MRKLPHRFRSWVHVWQEINKAGHIARGARVIYFAPDLMWAESVNVVIEPTRITVDEIIGNVLKELLEEKPSTSEGAIVR